MQENGWFMAKAVVLVNLINILLIKLHNAADLSQR